MPPFISLVLLAGIGAWQTLGDGLEYRTFEAPKTTPFGDTQIHVVRIDPAKARLRLLAASALDRKKRTAAGWSKEFELAAAINAGMFDTDHVSNVGYMRDGEHVNNPRWRPDYKSVLLFAPKDPKDRAALLLDRDTPSFEATVSKYGAVIQNLRLLKAPAQNVWQKSDKRWSEAAVAMDRKGRILFIFSRSPYPMHELNAILAKLPINIETAMHVEGGPEASLSIHAGSTHLDLAGSFETGFNENDDNAEQWPIPNVLGVVLAGAPAPK